jgi:hypothetical protein
MTKARKSYPSLLGQLGCKLPGCIHALAALTLSSGCGAEGAAGSGAAGLANGVAAQLRSSGELCLGQKALLPASGTITQTIVATREQGFRTNSSDQRYVSYQVTLEDMFLYLSFAPDLPASFTTAQTLAAFDYAYIQYDLEQPEPVGGSLVLLDSNDLLDSSDFERLEVIGDLLSFRLTRVNAGDYRKRLSNEDLDPSVDRSLCHTGDISDRCWCDFSGPPTTITLDGTFPI